MAKRRSKSPSLFDAEADTTVMPPSGGGEAVSLHEAAQARYLNYALSVITSRAFTRVLLQVAVAHLTRISTRSDSPSIDMIHCTDGSS